MLWAIGIESTGNMESIYCIKKRSETIGSWLESTPRHSERFRTPRLHRSITTQRDAQKHSPELPTTQGKRVGIGLIATSFSPLSSR
jgi:hypothetical protein